MVVWAMRICLAGRVVGGSHGAGVAWAGWTQTAWGTGPLVWKPWPWASVLCSLGFGGEYPQCWGGAPSTRFDPLTLNVSEAQVSHLGPWCVSFPSLRFSAFAVGPLPASRVCPPCASFFGCGRGPARDSRWADNLGRYFLRGPAAGVLGPWGGVGVWSPSGAPSVGDRLP